MLASHNLFLLKFLKHHYRVQMNLLLEGLINHPYVGIDPSDRSVLELRALIAKLEEAEVKAYDFVSSFYNVCLHVVSILGLFYIPCSPFFCSRS